MGMLKEVVAAGAALVLLQVANARFTYPDCADGPLSENTICDQDAEPAERAAALVAAMSTTDKLANLIE
jgi:xylan 1,4-beta-xylosidase